MKKLFTADDQRMQQTIVKHLQKHWKLFFAEGVFLVILGTLAIIVPQVITLGIIIFLGWLLVTHTVAGHGLGTLLMHRIISYAKTQRLDEIYGEVLDENKVMISICKKLGFLVHKELENYGVVEVRLELRN